MAPTVQYHCACLSNSQIPPPPHLPSSAYSFHPLHSLFFCEECDAVRCNRCVSVEVSTYYCPNCLFEVPSASVRAEKNRCARNCFMCPICRNTLSVVPSDPPDNDGRLLSPTAIIGEAPFFLYCNHCRWDSVEVGITFEKPTGLAAQLQKFEDSAPDSLEFDRLKEHFEPFLRASSLSSSTSTAPAAAHHSSAAHSHHLHSTSITAAASAALARDIPGVSKYNPLARSTSARGSVGSGRDRSANKDEMTEYRSRVDISSAGASGIGGGDADVEFMTHLKDMNEVATLEQRKTNSWVTSLRTRDLKPLRIPLHSKRSKRCQACTHILIKPEQKAQSVRYKIKLVAANYLPDIAVSLPAQQKLNETAKRSLGRSTILADDVLSSHGGLQAGKTHPFHLALTNPLYDPIQVRLSVQRVHISTTASVPGESPEKARRPPFAVSLPTSSFSIAAFAEAWEYEDDEDMFGTDDDDELGRLGKDKDAKAKAKAVGVLEKRTNVTVVGGEVVIGKEAGGNVKFNMLVSYTYRSDDPVPSESNEGDSSAKSSKPPEIKTFAFYTVVDLGPIIPKEEVKLDL